MFESFRDKRQERSSSTSGQPHRRIDPSAIDLGNTQPVEIVMDHDRKKRPRHRAE